MCFRRPRNRQSFALTWSRTSGRTASAKFRKRLWGQFKFRPTVRCRRRAATSGRWRSRARTSRRSTRKASARIESTTDRCIDAVKFSTCWATRNASRFIIESSDASKHSWLSDRQSNWWFICRKDSNRGKTMIFRPKKFTSTFDICKRLWVFLSSRITSCNDSRV